MDTKVLVIDDDLALATMYQQAFLASGIACEVADGGEDGLAKAAQLIPAVILLDLMMPGKSGLDVLQQLKSSTSLQTIPVVMLTNLIGEPLEKEAREKGAAEFFNKSTFKPREIVEKVKALFVV